MAATTRKPSAFAAPSAKPNAAGQRAQRERDERIMTPLFNAVLLHGEAMDSWVAVYAIGNGERYGYECCACGERHDESEFSIKHDDGCVVGLAQRIADAIAKEG